MHVAGVKPLIQKSELRTSTKVAVSVKEKSSFHFVVFWKILHVMTLLKLVDEGQCIRIIMSPTLVEFNYMLILYGGLDAWPMHNEIPGITLLCLEKMIS